MADPNTRSGFSDPLRPRTIAIACAALISLYLALFAGGMVSAKNGLMSTGDPVGQDFTNFYAAATFVREGRPADVYPLDRFNAEIRRVHPGATATYIWNYPPPTSLLVAPLAWLPFGLAMTVWTAIGVGAFVYAARRLSPHRLTVLAALASPALFWDAWHHQLGGLGAALLGLGFFDVARGRLRGAPLIGLMVIKPHLAVAAPFVLAAGRRWTAIVVAGLTLGAACLISYLVLGKDMWATFLVSAGRAKALLESAGQLKSLMPSAFVTLQMLGAPIIACWLAQAIVGVAALGGAVSVWIRTPAPGLRTAAALAACALISPYTFAYDSTLCALAVAAVAGEALQGRVRLPASGWMTLAWFWPLPAAAIAFLYHLQLGWLGPAAVLGFVVAEVGQSVARPMGSIAGASA